MRSLHCTAFNNLWGACFVWFSSSNAMSNQKQMWNTLDTRTKHTRKVSPMGEEKEQMACALRPMECFFVFSLDSANIFLAVLWFRPLFLMIQVILTHTPSGNTPPRPFLTQTMGIYCVDRNPGRRVHAVIVPVALQRWTSDRFRTRKVALEPEKLVKLEKS